MSPTTKKGAPPPPKPKRTRPANPEPKPAQADLLKPIAPLRPPEPLLSHMRELPKRGSCRLLKSTTEELPVALTQEELLDRGQKLAQVEVDLRTQQIAANATRKELKEAESKLRALRTELAAVVRSRKEPRPVKVETTVYFNGGPPNGRPVVRAHRIDTGEVLFSRDATPEELQQPLPLAGEEPTP